MCPPGHGWHGQPLSCTLLRPGGGRRPGCGTRRASTLQGGVSHWAGHVSNSHCARRRAGAQQVTYWDALDGQAIRVLDAACRLAALAVHPGGELLAAGGEDRVVRLLNYDEGAPAAFAAAPLFECTNVCAHNRVPSASLLKLKSLHARAPEGHKYFCALSFLPYNTLPMQGKVHAGVKPVHLHADRFCAAANNIQLYIQRQPAWGQAMCGRHA